jgi:hypothetical protein
LYTTATVTIATAAAATAGAWLRWALPLTVVTRYADVQLIELNNCTL